MQLKQLAYLACPYTGDSNQQMIRKDVATWFAAELAREYAVYSPLTHGCALEKHLPEHISNDHGFWMTQCMPILAASDVMLILPIPGWRASKGVQMEILAADKWGIDIAMIKSPYYNCEQVADAELLENG